MILGQTPRHASYARPAGANPNFQPRLPGVGFFSHFNPFSKVMERMQSASGFYNPPLNPYMGPQALPPVPDPTPVAAVPTPVAPIVPKAGGTAGFAGSGFGSPGGTKMHAHVDPYMIMRQGVFPGVMPSGANIRYPLMHSGDRVQRSLPYQQVTRSIMVPVPLPPPPPAVIATPAALHGFGRPHRRGFFSRLISPPTVAETQSCETIGPRSDGLMVTICNGRVTEYRDASGNVSRPQVRDFAGW